MNVIQTSIEISAPTARVWEILMDFSRYPEWNPFITSISGTPRVGEKLNVRVHPPGKGGMSFSPAVLAVRPEREFRWKGKVLIGGLFDGEHYFLMKPMTSGTEFSHGEQFSGILVPFFSSTLAATEQGFRDMNERLKQRAEA